MSIGATCWVARYCNSSPKVAPRHDKTSTPAAPAAPPAAVAAADRFVVCSPPVFNTQQLEPPANPRARHRPVQLHGTHGTPQLPNLIQLPARRLVRMVPAQQRQQQPMWQRRARWVCRQLPMPRLPQWEEAEVVKQHPQQRATQVPDRLKATPGGFNGSRRHMVVGRFMDPGDSIIEIERKEAPREGAPELNLWQPLITDSNQPWIPLPPKAPHVYKRGLPDVSLLRLPEPTWLEGQRPQIPEIPQDLPERKTPMILLLVPTRSEDEPESPDGPRPSRSRPPSAPLRRGPRTRGVPTPGPGEYSPKGTRRGSNLGFEPRFYPYR